MSFQQNIKIPEEKVVGHLIGQGGSQVKKLKELTGCIIDVKAQQLLVTIKGQSDKVKRAADLVQLIINNAMAVYEHPNAVCNVLKDIGRESKFHLNNNKVSHSFIHSKGVENKLIEEGVERVSNSLLEISKDDSLKHKIVIKASLGKKTFYSANRSIPTLDTNKKYTFPLFSNLEFGYNKDLKSTWKTEIDEKLIAKLKEYLNQNEWVLDNESEGVSCHFVEVVEGIIGKENSKGGKRLDFKVEREGTNKCKLVKIRHKMNKLMFLDICKLQAETSSISPDLRIRFQTEQHELNINSQTELNNYISYLEFQQDEISDAKVPSQLKAQFRKDTLRYKKKEIFKFGKFKLSINFVKAEGRKWFEVQLSPIVPFSLENSKEEMIEFCGAMIGKMDQILENINK